MNWVDCELSHGPRKSGTKCQACAALQEVGQLRARVAQLEQALKALTQEMFHCDGIHDASVLDMVSAALDGRDEKGKGV